MKGVKALMEAKVNGNTRTLAMFLKSERELLSANKEQELEIHKLKLMLEVKNKEVEKLKDLCLKQREEIRSLKNSVKADKYPRACIHYPGSSPGTPSHDHEETANSLEFSSCDGATPGSPADMLLKDLNPCLTPYCAEKKSKEFEAMGYESSLDVSLFESNTQTSNELSFGSRLRKLSKSSDCYQNCSSGSTMTRSTRRSEETKEAYRKQAQQRHF
ncbi:hypothetical protein OIU77_018243 [Salix suchowensis]|uniref:Uncharacterized protein n=1 Tax=Salix suchowensis TaxID=1278906 RepID=A0ABQ8ZRJ4_9ROSI|nr:hypothetical protein OIU77_018243 [Salix suchowensis]